MSESEKQPTTPTEPEPLSYKVVKTVAADENGDLFRDIRVVKLNHPVAVQQGDEDQWLESDHFVFTGYHIVRTNHLNVEVDIKVTSLVAYDEDKERIVPGAVLYKSNNNLSLAEAMFTIGVL